MTNNCVDYIRLGSSLIPLIDSYHPILDFILSISTPEFLSEKSCPVVFNFNACNFNDVNLFLKSIDIMSNLTNLNVDIAVLKLNEILNHSFDMFVPKIKLNHYNSRSIYWSNPILRNLFKLKKEAHKKYTLTNSHSDYIFFSNLRSNCKKLSSQVHANHLLKIENNININQKSY